MAPKQLPGQDLQLQLQGQKVPGAGAVLGVGCSFAEFNAYDVGLCCESSSSSCCLSAGSFLQPVPSLPGLAEPLNGSLYAPAGARHAGFSTVKLTKQPAASFGSSSGSGGSTSLSPTQHLAWRPAHGSHARSATADRIPVPQAAKGVSGAGSQSNAAGVAAVALPGRRSHDAIKLPRVLHITSSSGQSKHPPAATGAAAVRAEPPGPCHSERLTMIQVPDGVVTGLDALRYFCSGAGQPGDLVFCMLAQQSPGSGSVTGGCSAGQPASEAPCGAAKAPNHLAAAADGAAATPQACSGDAFNPYDLRAVPQELACKQEQQHWVFTCQGVTHMRASEPPDITPHAEWLRQSELFAVLRGLSFVKQWRIRTAFQKWAYATARLRFARRAEALEAALLPKHPAVLAALQQANWLCLHLSAAALPDSCHLGQPHMVPAGGSAEATAAASGAKGHARAACDAVQSAAVSGGGGGAGGAGNFEHGKGTLSQPQSHSAHQAEAALQGCTGRPAADATGSASTAAAAAAANAALVGELAAAAKGQLPQLQSRSVALSAPASGSRARALGPCPSRAEQMQAASEHSAKLLAVLCGVLQPEVVLTLSDLEQWTASAGASTAQFMASLCSQLQACMLRLQQQLLTELKVKQAAAAAEAEAACEAGCKPQLPWNVPAPFNISHEQRRVQTLLNRVAHIVNALVTSHASLLAEAATAHQLFCLLLPVDPCAAKQLCAQQQQGRLWCHSAPTAGQGLGVARRACLRLQASLCAQDGAAGQDSGAVCGSDAAPEAVRLLPSCEDLVAAASQLPTAVAAMLAALEPLPVAAAKASATSAGAVTTQDKATQAQPGSKLQTLCSRARLPSGRARNMRLETIMGTCRTVEVQAVVASAVEQEYKHTVSSLQLQPYKNADTQLQFCTAFDPQRYLQALSSARQLAEDVEGLGCWLAQLSPSGHVISVSSGRSRDSSSNESVHQHRGSIDGSTHSSRPGRGLVEVDVSAVRPALLKTGRAAFGSLLSVLHPAFMHCCERLNARLEEAIQTAGQRPDTLQAFIAWHAALHAPAQQALGQALAADAQSAGGAAGSGFLHGAAAAGHSATARLLLEVQALRQLQDIMRPGATGAAPDWLQATYTSSSSSGSSSGSSQAHVSHVNEAREAVMAAARQLSAAAARSAASALSALQVKVLSHKDAAKAAEAHATLMHNKLAPQMAQLLLQDCQELQRVTLELLASAATSVEGLQGTTAALQRLQQVQRSSGDLLLQHQDHIGAAAVLACGDVAQALKAHHAASDALSRWLEVLLCFRTAQQTWCRELELLYALPALHAGCGQRLQQLQTAGVGLLHTARAFEAVYSAAAKPTSSSKAGHAQPTFTTAAAADAQQWLHAATQDLAAAAGAESMLQLCRAVSLEVAAWQQRKPAAEQVLHPSMQLRHQLMLLTLCTLAEGGSMDRVQAALARQPAQQAKDPCPSTLSSPKRSPKRSAANSPGRSPGRSTASSPWCSSGTSNRSTVTSPDHILEALLHHDLVRRDAYASVFLPSMRVNASVGQQHSTDDGGADGGAASRPNSYARGGAAAVHDNTACGGGSMAALLVWVTRNAATAFFLTGVLGIAQREQLLLEQVDKAEGVLKGMHLPVSAARTAGVFVCRFGALEQRLLEVQGQLAAVQQDSCHKGLLPRLQSVTALQQQLLAAAQTCQACQEHLFRLHNLSAHPTLAGCLSDTDQAAVTAAVRPWAEALLKACCHITNQTPRGNDGRLVGGGSGSPNVTAVPVDSAAAAGGCMHGLGLDLAAAEGDTGDADASLFRQLQLESCMELLAAAAGDSLKRMQQVAGPIAAKVLEKLRQRWPRLAVVPDAALTELLEELPAVFRAARAVQQQQQQQQEGCTSSSGCALPQLRQQEPVRPKQVVGGSQQHQPVVHTVAFVHLPQGICDALFRGVSGLVPTMAPILQQQQQQHLSQLQQAASGTHTTCHSPGDRRSGGTSPRAAAHAGRLSDCPLEPLTAAEAAQGIGSMQVAAWPTAAEQHSMSSSLGACAQGTVLQQLSLRGRVDAAARAGVLWSISDCPAEALKALHAAASAALKQDMAAALASASAMPVERWAGSHTCQALLLADAVLWTRAASQALQQLAMGNSRALRALSDAAVLRLETVSVALQGRLQSGSQHTATKAPSAAAGAAASGAPGKLGGSGSSAAGASSRSSSCATSETCPSWQETASSDSHKQHHVQVLVVQHGSKEREHLARDKQDCVPQKAGTLPATGIVVGAAAAAAQRITTHGGSSSGTACNDSAHPDQQPAVQLSQQQVLGLQALVSAAACHRDVAATLIAASSSGRTPHEEWGKQLRHYWQPDTQELQVCFGPVQLRYGWHYCPAAASSWLQPLAAGLLSGPSLLAAAAALELGPVLGLDLTSWQQGGGVVEGSGPAATAVAGSSPVAAAFQGGNNSSSSNRASSAATCSSSSPAAGLRASAGHGVHAPSTHVPVVSSMAAAADTLAGVLGCQAFHFSCCSDTPAAAVSAWLTSLLEASSAAAAAAAAAQAVVGAAALASAAAGAAAVTDSPRPAIALLGSISGLECVVPPVLSAFSELLMSLQGKLAQRITSTNARASGKGVSSANLRSTGGCAWPLHVLVELPGPHVPAAAAAAVSELRDGRNGKAGLQVRRGHAVWEAVQLSGRCLVLQHPSAHTLLEIGLRRLGLSHARMCAAALASLLQRAAGLTAAGRQKQQQAPAKQPLQQAGMLLRASTVQASSVTCVFQHLSVLLQLGHPLLQQGASAWGSLQLVTTGLLLPWVESCRGDTAQLQQHLQQLLHTAEQSGCASFSSQHKLQAGASLTGVAAATCGHSSSVTSNPMVWAAGRVAAAASELCCLWRAAGDSMPHNTTSQQHASEPAGLCRVHGPCLLSQQAAEVVAAVHQALQLHGTCVLLGPAGSGKTLSCGLLAAAYDRLQQQQKPRQAPQQQQQHGTEEQGQQCAVAVVHCYQEVLLDSMSASGARHVQGDTREAIVQLIQGHYAAAMQRSAVGAGVLPEPGLGHQQLHQQQQQPQEEEQQQQREQEQQLRSSRSSAAPTHPQALLVLHTPALCGPLAHLLLHLLQHEARTRVTHSRQQEPHGWAGLPGCIGCVVEVGSAASASTTSAAAAAGLNAGPSAALLQQLPVVVLPQTGLLDHKQQLQADVLAAFRPLAVAVPYPAAQATFEDAPDTPGADQGSNAGMAATPQTAAAAGVGPGKVGTPASESAAAAAPVLQLSLSNEALSSLTALLAELVSAGTALLGLQPHTRAHTPAAAAAEPSKLHEAQDVPAAAGSASISQALHARAYQLCHQVAAIAGAMWRQSTLGSLTLLTTSPVGSTSSSGSHQSSLGSSIEASGSRPAAVSSSPIQLGASAAAASTLPRGAELQLAARLLLYACSWVLSGRCPQPAKQMRALHDSLLAVLSGSGYAWAAPPSAVGLLGARVSLSTGQWVSWTQDLHKLTSSNSSCTNGGWTSQEEFMTAEQVGDDRVFVPSARTCALQHFLFWALQAGLSPYVLAQPGSGMRAAMKQLLMHTRIHATAAAAAAASPVGGVAAAGHRRGGFSAGGFLSLAPGLTAPLAAALLQPLACKGRPPVPQQLGHRSGSGSCFSCLDWQVQGCCCSSSSCTLREPLVLLLGQQPPAASVPWLQQVLEARPCSAPTTPPVLPAVLQSNSAPVGPPEATPGAAAAAAAGDCTCISWVHVLQPVQLLVVAAPQQGSTQACLGTQLPAGLKQHMLAFDTQCLASCSSSSHSGRNCAEQPSGPLQGAQQQQPAPNSGCMCVDPAAVLQALLDHCCQELPQVSRVLRSHQLQALHSIWLGMSATLEALRSTGALRAAACCCFDLRHYKPALLQLVALCRQAAGWRGTADAWHQQLQLQQQEQGQGPGQKGGVSGTTVPQTPCTPAAALLCSPGACRTPHGLAVRRLPLRTFCLMVVEVLCRAVPDGLASAEDQQTLQRCVVLLVVQHLATLDQQAAGPGNSTNSCSGQEKGSGTADSSAQGGSSAETVAAARASACTSVVSSARGSSRTSSDGGAGDKAPAGVCLLQAMAAAQGSHDRDGSIAPGFGPPAAAAAAATAAAAVTGSSPQPQQQQLLLLLWQQLQVCTDAQLSEQLRRECLPAVLSGHFVSQLLAMAARGRDPVQQGQPLHMAVAAHELAGLLSQQRQQWGQAVQQQQPQQQLIAGAQDPRGAASLPAYSSSNNMCWQALQGGAVAFADAAQLLGCSAWLAAVHKLMWRWHDTAATTAAAAAGAAGAAAAAGACASPCRSFGVPSQGLGLQAACAVPAVQSVTVLVGPSAAVLQAAAVTAAAATDCTVLSLTAAELLSQEAELLGWLHGAVVPEPAAAVPTLCEGVQFASALCAVACASQPGQGTQPGALQQPGAQQQRPQPYGAQQGVVLVVGPTQDEDLNCLDAQTASLLQRWSSRQAWVTVPAAGTASGSAAAGDISTGTPEAAGTDEVSRACRQVHLVLVCLSGQQQQLLLLLQKGALGSASPGCFWLSLPGQPTRAQLQQDVEALLLDGMCEALSDHLADAAAALATAGPGPRPPPPQQQQLLPQGCSSPLAAVGVPQDPPGPLLGAKQLARSLAAGLVEAHRGAVAAFAAHFSTGSGTPAYDGSGSGACLHAKQPGGRTDGSSGSKALVVQGGVLPSASYEAACNAVPQPKLAAALQAAQQLLPKLRRPLLARRSALKAALAGISRHQQQLGLASAHRGSDSHTDTDAATAAATAAEAESLSGQRSAAGLGAPQAVPEQALLGGLVQLGKAWTSELQQVECDLARALPHALLAALQLTYLGPLPLEAQQQLVQRWEALLLQAAGVQGGAASAAYSGTQAQQPLAGIAGESEQGHATAAFELLSHLSCRPASAVMDTTQLLQPQGPLWTQLQAAAAAVDVVRQPLLVLDPWSLLPTLLSVSSTAAAAATAGGVDTTSSCSGSSQKHRKGCRSACRSVPAAADPQNWCVLHAASYADGNMDAACDSAAVAAAAAASEAFAAGQSVWLQLQGLALPQHQQLAMQATQAWRQHQQLMHAEHAEGISSKGGSNSSSTASPQGDTAAARAGARALPGQRRVAALTSPAPRLVIHVASGSSAGVPATLAGQLSIVSIGAESSTAPSSSPLETSSSHGTEAAQSAPQEVQVLAAGGCIQGMLMLQQLVQWRVLQRVDPGGCAAAVAAARAAEEAADAAGQQEALVLQHVSQGPASAGTAAILLRSLAREVQQLQQLQAHSRQAATAAAEQVRAMSSKWVPAVAAMAQMLLGSVSCAPGSWCSTSSGNGSRSDQQQQQQQALLEVLPVPVMQALLTRAADAAVGAAAAAHKEQSLLASAGPTTAAASNPACKADELDPCCKGGAAASGAPPAALSAASSFTNAAMRQLEQDLALLLCCPGISAHRRSSSSRTTSEREQGLLQPLLALALKQLLTVVPASIPLCLCAAGSLAAGLATVLAAAAAAGMPADAAGVTYMHPPSNIAAAAAGAPEAAAGARPGDVTGSCGDNTATTTSSSRNSVSCGCGLCLQHARISSGWHVLLVGCAAAIPAAAAAAQHLLHCQRTFPAGVAACRNSTTSPLSKARVWLILGSGAAAASSVLAGQCLKLRLGYDAADAAAAGVNSSASPAVASCAADDCMSRAGQVEERPMPGALAACTIDLLLQTQGAELLLSQQYQAQQQQGQQAPQRLLLQQQGQPAIRDGRHRLWLESCSSEGSSAGLCVLQPLLVAALTAFARSGLSDRVTLHDLAHCRLLLERAAAGALGAQAQDSWEPPSSAAAAAMGPSTVVNPAAVEAPGVTQRGPRSSRSSSTSASLRVPSMMLKGTSSLQLGLQHLQELLLWAVVAPCCSNGQQLQRAAQALQAALSTVALGVRQKYGDSAAGVEVLPGCCLHALDDVADECVQHGAHCSPSSGSSSSRDGSSSNGSDSNSGRVHDSGSDDGSSSDNGGTCWEVGDPAAPTCLLPLGLCLGLDGLTALLQRRMT